MKILILTTAYKRPELTKFHIRRMNYLKAVLSNRRIKSEDDFIEIIPLYVFSNFDPFTSAFVQLIREYRLNADVNEQGNLSNKIQEGLYNALNDFEWDYLMHLDSDEFITPAGIIKLVEFMKHGEEWFGPSKQIFYNALQKTGYYFQGYKRQELVNGGSCIRRDILEETGGILWTSGLNSGLNTNEHINLKQRGYSPKVITLETFDLVEVKTGDDIHPLVWFNQNGYDLVELDGHSMKKLYAKHGLSSLKL